MGGKTHRCQPLSLPGRIQKQLVDKDCDACGGRMEWQKPTSRPSSPPLRVAIEDRKTTTACLGVVTIAGGKPWLPRPRGLEFRVAHDSNP